MERNEKATLELEEKNSEEKELGMGWHDFMVFCGGFTGVVGIIGGIVLAILALIAFEPLGFITSIACTAMAIYSFEIRDGLKNFQEEAPKKLINITYSR